MSPQLRRTQRDVAWKSLNEVEEAPTTKLYPDTINIMINDCFLRKDSRGAQSIFNSYFRGSKQPQGAEPSPDEDARAYDARRRARPRVRVNTRTLNIMMEGCR